MFHDFFLPILESLTICIFKWQILERFFDKQLFVVKCLWDMEHEMISRFQRGSEATLQETKKGSIFSRKKVGRMTERCNALCVSLTNFSKVWASISQPKWYTASYVSIVNKKKSSQLCWKREPGCERSGAEATLRGPAKIWVGVVGEAYSAHCGFGGSYEATSLILRGSERCLLTFELHTKCWRQ